MGDYAFADPAIVRAVSAEDSPFERRDMLLEGRFHGLRFHFGVRVGGLVGEELATGGRPAHIPNPVIRLGFRVFGRRVQRRFARHACQRMARLTAAQARVGAPATDPPTTSS